VWGGVTPSPSCARPVSFMRPTQQPTHGTARPRTIRHHSSPCPQAERHGPHHAPAWPSGADRPSAARGAHRRGGAGRHRLVGGRGWCWCVFTPRGRFCLGAPAPRLFPFCVAVAHDDPHMCSQGGGGHDPRHSRPAGLRGRGGRPRSAAHVSMADTRAGCLWFEPLGCAQLVWAQPGALRRTHFASLVLHSRAVVKPAARPLPKAASAQMGWVSSPRPGLHPRPGARRGLVEPCISLGRLPPGTSVSRSGQVKVASGPDCFCSGPNKTWLQIGPRATAL
jgi:hypothetical protein